jgi:hypothetical protein
MPEMKAIEFTDKLNLQPVTRPVPQPFEGVSINNPSTETANVWAAG